jgi:hypothetical protein
MSVNEGLNDYSTTAASNTPAGSDNIGTDLDDHLRDIKKNLRTASQHSKGITEPTHYAGRTWYDTSGTASNWTILKISDGSAYIDLFDINISANTAYARTNPLSGVPTSRTISAGNALSGGGTLSSDRALSVANASTATITHTAAILNWTIDPFGRVIASSSAVTLATAAIMEDRSSTAHYVTPVRVKDHLGVAKFWVNCQASATASVTDSYNVSSVVRSAVGVYTINFTTAFNDAQYAVMPSCTRTTGALRCTHVVAWATGSCRIEVINGSGDLADPERINVIGFGYHAT